MAAKDKTKKKRTKSKRAAGRKTAARNKSAATKPATKSRTRKMLAKSKKARKSGAVKRKGIGKKKTTAAKTMSAPEKQLRTRKRIAPRAFRGEGIGAQAGGQSGDLQGLSEVESADSESVDELLEEGNAFEADAVSGVENADDADEKEVRTHEVPEDDVPEEYSENE